MHGVGARFGVLVHVDSCYVTTGADDSVPNSTYSHALLSICVTRAIAERLLIPPLRGRAVLPGTDLARLSAWRPECWWKQHTDIKGQWAGRADGRCGGGGAARAAGWHRAVARLRV